MITSGIKCVDNLKLSFLNCGYFNTDIIMFSKIWNRFDRLIEVWDRVASIKENPVNHKLYSKYLNFIERLRIKFSLNHDQHEIELKRFSFETLFKK